MAGVELLVDRLGRVRRVRTHCARGHLLDEANTYHRPNQPNERVCRICQRARQRGGPTGRPTGRPSHEPTKALRGLVHLIASLGVSRERIAEAMGLSHRTLEKRYPDELARGLAAVNSAIANTYVQKMLGGRGVPEDPFNWERADTAMLLHYLRSRLGWGDKTELVFRLGQGADFRDI